MILNTVATIGAERLAQRRVERDVVDRHRQIVRELGGIDGIKAAFFKLEIDKEASFARHYAEQRQRQRDLEELLKRDV